MNMSQATAIPAEGVGTYDPAHDAPAHHHPIYDYDSGPPVDRAKFAMWLFLATEVMFFTGLIGTYLVLRVGSNYWPNPEQRLAVTVTAVNTFLLIMSSWTMVRALHSIQKGNQKGLVLWLAGTILGGATFVSVQVFEYLELVHAGSIPSVDIFWSTFYTMTGFHGLHVIVGVIWLVATWISAVRGKFSAKNYVRVEMAGLYWHFVDLVWVLLFTIVYLM
jgi:heme/copper-type cytochrome/quinol oxidase subunit 3